MLGSTTIIVMRLRLRGPRESFEEPSPRIGRVIWPGAVATRRRSLAPCRRRGGRRLRRRRSKEPRLAGLAEPPGRGSVPSSWLPPRSRTGRHESPRASAVADRARLGRCDPCRPDAHLSPGRFEPLETSDERLLPFVLLFGHTGPPGLERGFQVAALPAARFERPRAPGVEGASERRVDGVGHLSAGEIDGIARLGSGSGIAFSSEMV